MAHLSVTEIMPSIIVLTHLASFSLSSFDKIFVVFSAAFHSIDFKSHVWLLLKLNPILTRVLFEHLSGLCLCSCDVNAG